LFIIKGKQHKYKYLKEINMYHSGGSSLFKNFSNGKKEYVGVGEKSSEENVGKTTTQIEADHKTTSYIMSQF